MSAHIDPLIAAAPPSPTPPTPAAFEGFRSASVRNPSHAVGTAGRVHVVEDIEDVYRRMYPGLVRMAYLLVDTQEAAEEAVQDAFAKAYTKWSRVETPEAYMRTCVINACRKVHRRRRVMGRVPQPSIEHGELYADHIADVVRTLRPPMREAVVLRYYLQLSDPEIAEALGIAVGTVKSTLHRARALLKKELS